MLALFHSQMIRTSVRCAFYFKCYEFNGLSRRKVAMLSILDWTLLILISLDTKMDLKDLGFHQVGFFCFVFILLAVNSLKDDWEKDDLKISWVTEQMNQGKAAQTALMFLPAR